MVELERYGFGIGITLIISNKEIGRTEIVRYGIVERARTGRRAVVSDSTEEFVTVKVAVGSEGYHLESPERLPFIRGILEIPQAGSRIVRCGRMENYAGAVFIALYFERIVEDGLESRLIIHLYALGRYDLLKNEGCLTVFRFEHDASGFGPEIVLQNHIETETLSGRDAIQRVNVAGYSHQSSHSYSYYIDLFHKQQIYSSRGSTI